MWKFEVYADADEGWYWRLAFHDKTLVHSERYANSLETEQAVKDVRASLATTAIVIVHENAFHSELRADDTRWNALPFVGLQQGDDPHDTLELRDCVCGSTLGRRVTRGS